MGSAFFSLPLFLWGFFFLNSLFLLLLYSLGRQVELQQKHHKFLGFASRALHFLFLFLKKSVMILSARGEMVGFYFGKANRQTGLRAGDLQPPSGYLDNISINPSF